MEELSPTLARIEGISPISLTRLAVLRACRTTYGRTITNVRTPALSISCVHDRKEYICTVCMLNKILENTIFMSVLGVNNRSTSTESMGEEGLPNHVQMLPFTSVNAYLYFDAVVLLSVTAKC